MITRSNLAEQLREYQVRSKHEWATLSFFSSTATNTSSWVDAILVVWELSMLASLIFSGVALFFRYMKAALVLISLTFLMFLCIKVTKQVRRNRKMKRKMLLPLSM
ncbi:uncharacterized protein LOC121998626 [Zingiber officinale]|uniref:Uncharacterized protein n=1 Tax=Zingiber officinale TaxID=94328 RepID=A0A8J5G7K8_ZINOF|nr:uncharacterized protein LOC121998626 [Zingiber officinale]KAG6502230.1 hypothetical protein ZIOFF_042119 [Zingiber officinale]